MTLIEHIAEEAGRLSPAGQLKLLALAQELRMQEEQLEADMDAVIAENLPALKELAK